MAPVTSKSLTSPENHFGRLRTYTLNLNSKSISKIPVGSRKSGRSGVRCITLGSGLGGGRMAPRCSRCSPRLGGAADGGGRRWGRLARTVGINLLTLARPETIHCGSDNVVNLCSKSGSEKKTQKWRSLPKRTDCTCKKTQDLMPSANRNHFKVL